MFGNRKRFLREPQLPPNVTQGSNPVNTNKPVEGRLVGPGTVPTPPRDDTEEFLFGKSSATEKKQAPGSRFDNLVADPAAVKPAEGKAEGKADGVKSAEGKDEGVKSADNIPPVPWAYNPSKEAIKAAEGKSEAAKPAPGKPEAPKPGPVRGTFPNKPEAPKPGPVRGTFPNKPEAPKPGPAPTSKPAPAPATKPEVTKAKSITESSALLFINDRPDKAYRAMETHTRGKPVYLIDMTKDKSGGKYVPDSAMRSFIGSSKLPGGGSADADYDIVDIVGLISTTTPGESPFLVITGTDHLVSRVYESLGKDSLAVTMLAEKVNDTIAEAEKAGVTIVVVTEELTKDLSDFMNRIEEVKETAGDKV